MDKKSSNKNLRSANKAKNDEFYTQLSDIEKEVKNYKEHFKDKVVFLNCDDPEESTFWKFFSEKFEILELKSLVSTHFEKDKPSYKLEIIKDVNKDGKLNKLDTIKTPLKQNGDFRSPECIEILKNADIVVTNPPFSLFRDYVAQLVKYDKKFLIIGSINGVKYVKIFPLIRENKIWLGYTYPKEFLQPDNSIKKFGNISWFTNLDTKKRHENILLVNKYYGSEDKYLKYDNYDAINIDKVKEIPFDYDGMMGVPITFLDKYNPRQFEIVGVGQGDHYRDLTPKGLSSKFVADYYKHGGTGKIKEDHPILAYYNKEGKAVIPYMRIIIRNKRIIK